MRQTVCDNCKEVVSNYKANLVALGTFGPEVDLCHRCYDSWLAVRQKAESAFYDTLSDLLGKAMPELEKQRQRSKTDFAEPQLPDDAEEPVVSDFFNEPERQMSTKEQMAHNLVKEYMGG